LKGFVRNVKRKKVLKINHPHDIIDRLGIYRQPRESFFVHQKENIVNAGSRLDAHNIGTGNHYFFYYGIGETKYAVDEIFFRRLEDAAFSPFSD
jgi:hypothetical protein